MRDDHIINLIEERPLGNLSPTEIERVNVHTADCAECLRAFEAAQVSSRLLRERASITVEPSPFFQTRVLAAIRKEGRERDRKGGRERDTEISSAPELFGFQKVWQAARVLLTSMAAVVVVLTALTFLTDRGQQVDRPDVSSGSGAGVAALVIFDDANSDNDDMTYSQVLTNLYDQEVEGAYGRQQ